VHQTSKASYCLTCHLYPVNVVSTLVCQDNQPGSGGDERAGRELETRIGCNENGLWFKPETSCLLRGLSWTVVAWTDQAKWPMAVSSKQ